MAFENEKIGITVDDWDALRADPEKFAALKNLLGDRAAIILSARKTDALPIVMRDFCPRTFVGDHRVLSPSRLARLCGRIFHFDGTELHPLDIVVPDVPMAPRFGYIVSNGYGLGHVTRMQAIQAGLAQYGPSQVMSFSAGLTRDAFYLPSPQYLELDRIDGLAYVREATRRFLTQADPTHVFYDGNNIPSGVLAALADRPHIHLTWVRRGMWQPGTAAKFMASQALVDLVLEPGDLSDPYDTGPSWNDRHAFCPPGDFLKTLPIRPHNPPVLSREVAMAEFALDPRHKHALLMLGAMQKAEDNAVVLQAVEEVRKAGYVPVIAHWPISHDEAPRIQWALTIERMGIARYYKAFDVMISAAGYNSFHELIAAGYPTVFVPQEDEGRDQQLARARYAADQGLAQICRRTELDQLHARIPLAQRTSTKIKWLEDFGVIARALKVEKADGRPAKRRYIVPNPRMLKKDYRTWKRGKAKLYDNVFVMAFDMTTDKFLEKSARLPRKNTIVLTDSVDAIALRRAGFKYVWVNGHMLTDFGFTRQFIGWLNLWKPKKIKDLSAKFALFQ